MPYEGVHCFSGDRSDPTDDIGSYRYGEREFTYLETIETKSHIAYFYTSNRQDGRGVRAEKEWNGGVDFGNFQQRLDSIQLFSKEDLTRPIQTAVFVYDYDLCPFSPNSSGGFNEGKLTLKSLYIKYENSEKGAQNPYHFTYSAQNPQYNGTKMDRWGNFKENGNHYDHYVTQDSAKANAWASAWSLTGITFPEGGSLSIYYESDDYAYVQNRQATAMTKMTGVHNFEKLNGDYVVTFAKKSGVPVQEYVKNFDQDLLFFKIASRFAPGNVPDYIQGYVEIDLPKTLAVNNDASAEGILVLKPFPVADVHPIFLHCCQHLKNQRPDLLFGNIDAHENVHDLVAFFRALVSNGVISEFLTMFGNRPFYNYCAEKSYYKNAVFDDHWMPSYLRLNVPSKVKYGGARAFGR